MLRRSQRDTRSRRDREESRPISGRRRSRSPIREESRLSRDRSRERDDIEQEEDQESGLNIPLLKIENTPFTFGIEYEPTFIHYYDHNQGHHYDREIVHEKDKTKITIEKYDVLKTVKNSIDKKIEEAKKELREKSDVKESSGASFPKGKEEDEKKIGKEVKEELEEKYNDFSCSYNIELSIGVFKIDHISEFIYNNEKFNTEIRENLDNFTEYIEKDNEEFLSMRKITRIKNRINELKEKGEEEESAESKAITEFVDREKTENIKKGYNEEEAKQKALEKSVDVLFSLEDINDRVGNLRRFFNSNRPGNNNFKNCARTIPTNTIDAIDAIDMTYAPIKNELISGRPQLTIGMSYGFVEGLAQLIFKDRNKGLLSYYNEIMKSYKLSSGIDKDSEFVFRGFIFLIVYTSYIYTRYVSKSSGGNNSYLKSAFPLKPRTNLAESYLYIIRDYPVLSKEIDKYYQIVIDNVEYFRTLLNEEFEINIDPFLFSPIVGTYLGNQSYDRLQYEKYRIDVFYKINSSRKISLINDIIRNSEKYNYGSSECKTEYKYQCQFERIILLLKENIKSIPDIYNLIMKYFANLHQNYLMYYMKNPVKVAKIKIIDKTSIGNNCHILDNYVFSYVGEDKNNIDDMVRNGLIEIKNIHLYCGQPPVLYTKQKNTILCSNFREELFEWIPEDSNVIVELRSPEKLDEKNRSSSIYINEFVDFYSNTLRILSINFSNTIKIIQELQPEPQMEIESEDDESEPESTYQMPSEWMELLS